MSKKISKNVPNYLPTEDDYVLLFMPDDNGLWREMSNNLNKYYRMLLCDYLAEMELFIPDYCQFMRIITPDEWIEYRAYGERVMISYVKREDL